MKDKKGQALVEFVIILPLIIMLISAFVDFGKIYFTKNNLDSNLSIVIDSYNGNNYEEVKESLNKNIKDVELNIKSDNGYTLYELSKNVDILTPGLSNVLQSPYKVTVSRNMPNE